MPRTYLADTAVIRNICAAVERLEIRIKQLEKQLDTHTEQKITAGSIVTLGNTQIPRLIVDLKQHGYAAVDLDSGQIVSAIKKSVEKLIMFHEYTFVAASLKEYYASKVT